MPKLELEDITLNYREDGDPSGTAVVFGNSLGTTLHLWDQIMPLLPEGLRLVRYDMRGHGETDVPTPPYSMGALVRDAERLIDALDIRDCVYVGLSVGGLVAQGLATKRLDQVRAIVLSNTGAKIGNKQIWDDRINLISEGGMETVADATMERWFSKKFCDSPEITFWRDMLTATAPDGYIGCSHAISGTDFYSQTAALKLPALAIAGSEDGATPPDLVRETQELIHGSKFHLIRGAGHLPCVEKPEEYANVLNAFLSDIGHI